MRDRAVRVGLNGGAIDRWTFLEVNPDGQWAWLEDATGAPIASAIADALTREQR